MGGGGVGAEPVFSPPTDLVGRDIEKEGSREDRDDPATRGKRPMDGRTGGNEPDDSNDNKTMTPKVPFRAFDVTEDGDSSMTNHGRLAKKWAPVHTAYLWGGTRMDVNYGSNPANVPQCAPNAQRKGVAEAIEGARKLMKKKIEAEHEELKHKAKFSSKFGEILNGHYDKFTKDELREEFNKMDTDNTGTLNRRKVHLGMMEHAKVSNQTAQMLSAAIPSDCLTFEQFEKLLELVPEKEQEKIISKNLSKFKEKEMEEVKQVVESVIMQSGVTPLDIEDASSKSREEEAGKSFAVAAGKSVAGTIDRQVRKLSVAMVKAEKALPKVVVQKDKLPEKVQGFMCPFWMPLLLTIGLIPAALCLAGVL